MESKHKFNVAILRRFKLRITKNYHVVIFSTKGFLNSLNAAQIEYFFNVFN